jgi:hypothetical protein
LVTAESEVLEGKGLFLRRPSPKNSAITLIFLTDVVQDQLGRFDAWQAAMAAVIRDGAGDNEPQSLISQLIALD